MAALGRIEKIRDCAEYDHNSRAQKRKNQNQHDGENGQDQGVFDQGLSFLAGAEFPNRYWKKFKDGSHLRNLTGVT